MVSTIFKEILSLSVVLVEDRGQGEQVLGSSKMTSPRRPQLREPSSRHPPV